MVVTGPSDVRAIPWMGVCVCVGCVLERALHPWLRRNGETWFCPNPTLIPSRPTKAQFLYHYSISVCTQRCSTLAEQCQEQLMGHPLAKPFTNILSHQLLSSSHYFEFQGKERPGKSWIWLAANGWKRKGKMNHTMNLQLSFHGMQVFSSLMTLWFILNQRF